MLWSNYVSSANRNFGAHLQVISACTRQKGGSHVLGHDRADLPVVDVGRALKHDLCYLTNQGGDNACSDRPGNSRNPGIARWWILPGPGDQVSRLAWHQSLLMSLRREPASAQFARRALFLFSLQAQFRFLNFECRYAL